jgi:hypothetical protein
MPDKRTRPGGDGPSAIERHLPTPVDMRGVSDWIPVLAVDCSERSWGQVLVTCEAKASSTVESATDVENWPWVEVRIIVDINGQRVILLEGAVGSHNSAVIGGTSTKSSGPIFLPLYPGEVPDRLEVHARARRGGRPETHGDADEVLMLTAVARFHE